MSGTAVECERDDKVLRITINVFTIINIRIIPPPPESRNRNDRRKAGMSTARTKKD